MKNEDIQILMISLVICFIAWFTSSGWNISYPIKPLLNFQYAEISEESSEKILWRLFGWRVFKRTRKRKIGIYLVKKHGGLS